jgi:ADP-heptose:LPS heptosyltransferase
MSIGDEIMASGQALSLYRQTGKRIRVIDTLGNTRWSDMWRGLRYIVCPEDQCGESVDLLNCGGHRPHPIYAAPGEPMLPSGWRVRDNVGEMRFSRRERKFAKSVAPESFVVIEPHTNLNTWTENKQWGAEKWQQLASLLLRAGHVVCQLGPEGTKTLRGAQLIGTQDFRKAAAVLELATFSILPESGIHHAAGVLRRPAVVLFGGHTSPESTGYPWHRNVATTTCGERKVCQHCQDFWDLLTPDHVMAEVELLNGKA